MHDARPQLAADAAEIVDFMQERVDERALRVTGGGMDDHAGGFVDDDQVRILVDDVEVEILGLRRRARRFGNLDADGVASAYHSIGWNRPAGDGDFAAFDEALNPGARVARQHAREIPIDADACLFSRDDEIVTRGHKWVMLSGSTRIRKVRKGS
jgi:hypothetical protein